LTPRLLVTAGPTHEPIDAVRFVGNRSSGRLGVSVAEAGVELGWDVTLLLGPTHLPVPERVSRVYRFHSSAELSQLMEAHFRDCDLLIMAAAVADFRPIVVAEGKLDRSRGEQTLTLMPTPDLVASAASRKRAGQRIVAFALEPAESMVDRARRKLASKGVDAIVANPLGTMEAEDVTATWLAPSAEDGSGEVIETRTPGRMPKPAFARWLLHEAARRWFRGPGGDTAASG